MEYSIRREFDGKGKRKLEETQIRGINVSPCAITEGKTIFQQFLYKLK